MEKKRLPNLAGRQSITKFFKMYRGSTKKLLYDKEVIKAVTIKNNLFIQVTPLINTSILFVERDNGTEILILCNDSIIGRFDHPYIKPSQIIDKGRLIRDADKKHFQEVIEEDVGIEMFSQEKYDFLDSISKKLYKNSTWDLSHTLVYDIL